MTSLNPSAFACSAFAGLVVLEMACFAPKARANCVTALPTDPPIAGASKVFSAGKPARLRTLFAVKRSEFERDLRGDIRDRNTCGAHVVDTLRYQTKAFLPHCKPFTVGSIL